MKYLLLSAFAVVVLLGSSYAAQAQEEVTLLAPGGMRCPLDRIKSAFESRIGHPVKLTIGAGGAIHQQVVRGEAADVSIVQPPYQDVMASGNVVASSKTPLASIAIVVVVRKGDPKPNIATPEAFKQMLLGAKAISYPDGAGGLGGSAGVSIDETFKNLDIVEQMKAKTKRIAKVPLLSLLTGGQIDVVLTYASEVSDPGVEVVGALPREISTPTALAGFVSSHAKSPDAAKALLTYLASSDAVAAYKACAMVPGP